MEEGTGEAGTAVAVKGVVGTEEVVMVAAETAVVGQNIALVEVRKVVENILALEGFSGCKLPAEGFWVCKLSAEEKNTMELVFDQKGFEGKNT